MVLVRKAAGPNVSLNAPIGGTAEASCYDAIRGHNENVEGEFKPYIAPILHKSTFGSWSGKVGEGWGRLGKVGGVG